MNAYVYSKLLQKKKERVNINFKKKGLNTDMSLIFLEHNSTGQFPLSWLEKKLKNKILTGF